MISNFVAANGRIVIALLAASTVLAAPTQAKDQPASPAAPNEVLQATHSAEQVIAIPVPLPLPGQLKQFPQRTPPRAAGRSRPFQSRPGLVTVWFRSLEIIELTQGDRSWRSSIVKISSKKQFG